MTFCTRAYVSHPEHTLWTEFWRMGLQIADMAQSSSAMEKAKALIAKKDSIEAEIRELQANLRTVS